MNLRYLSLIVAYIMVTVILFCAALFAFSNLLEDRLFGNRRMLFVLVLIAYGVYRIFRLVKLQKEIKNDR